MTIKPMKQGEASARLLNSVDVRAMVKAIRQVGLFEIEEKAGTIRAHHITSGKEVFAAIQKGGSGTPWIARIHKQLFV